MTKGRLEAFSDGVIAIVITIMVLELRFPHDAGWEALRPMLPAFSTYVLSFAFLGIYWNNHHHMLHTAERINGRILWANLHLLFWLSLFPAVTAWMGGSRFAPVPTAVYGFVMLLAAVAYTVLQRAIVSEHGPHSKLAAAVGKDLKGKLSVALYAVAIPSAFASPWIAGGLYVLVALMWLVPDPRIESKMRLLPVLILTGLAVATPSRAEETGPSPWGAFAFADTSGTRVLSLSDLAAPESVRVLLTMDGRRLPVRHEGRQKYAGQGTGRDMARNFAYLPGERFRVEQGNVGGDATCFLATDALAALGGSAPVRRGLRPCDGSLEPRIDSEKQRRATGCWRLAEIGDSAPVELYEFAPVGTHYLACLALRAGTSVFTLDYPAELVDSSSVWRVDDEGKLAPEAFEVLFALQGPSAYAFAIGWAGAEGEYLQLLRTGDGHALESLCEGYRYWAP